MKALMLRIALVSILLTIPGVLLAMAAPSPSGGPTHHDCCKTAIVLKENARHEAFADFWLTIGNALNDKDGLLLDALREAWVECHETLALAEEQYQARLHACEALGHQPYDPDIQMTQFNMTVNNSFMPFVPGRTMIYRMTTSEGVEQIEVSILKETVRIDGVECLAVREYETLNEVLKEESINWIAQHNDGTVWYFGEISKIYEDGFLDSIEGSWRAGREGAKPGILMPAVPTRGHIYRQEFLLNTAEDIAQVVSVGHTVTVPYGTFTNCVMIEEMTPLEPEDDMQKFYAPGYGLVMEVDMNTGDRLELVRIIK